MLRQQDATTLSFSQGYVHIYMKLLGVYSVDFDRTYHLLFGYLLFLDTTENGGTMRQYLSYSQVSRKAAIQLGSEVCGYL
jgi:hypothetical protein